MGVRGAMVGGLILLAASGMVLWATLHDKPANLPAGQIRVHDSYGPMTPDIHPFVPVDPSQPSPALQKLQWLADESRCHVSDNPALMAGCVRERIAKVRAKALAYKARYEALRDLDRVYFEHLNRDGLVPFTTHIKKENKPDGFGQRLE